MSAPKNQRDKALSLFQHFERTLEGGAYSKALTAIFLFDFLDRIRSQGFPATWLDQLSRELDQLSGQFKVTKDLFLATGNAPAQTEELKDIGERTGEVYYRLWRNFSEKEYFEETKALLGERFKKNDIAIAGIAHALDDGCGSGRYTIALRGLGIPKVTGLDISENSVNFARSKNPHADGSVDFTKGSVLDLPFENSSFDFVFSNGVLHHTTDTLAGLKEIHRVLRPNGKVWLYLYGGKESFFWDTVDFCRRLLADVPQNYTQLVMHSMGYPPGRIFHRNDFYYVPINNRYFTAELEEMLRNSGFSEFRRLNRGVGHDWDEIIYNNPAIDPYIYGEGELRYLVGK